MMVRWCLLKQNVINCTVFFLLAYIICLFISAIVVGALLSTPLEYVGNSVHTIGSEGCEMASSSQAMIWSCRAINNPHGPPRGFPHITGSPSCWTVRDCRFKSSLWLSKNKHTSRKKNKSNERLAVQLFLLCAHRCRMHTSFPITS